MDQHTSARLRTFVAIARLEETASAFADLGFSLDQMDLTPQGKVLRDYYARIAMSLQDSLEELRVLLGKHWASETTASGD